MAIYRGNFGIFANFFVSLLLVSIDRETAATAPPNFVCPSVEPLSPCQCSVGGTTSAPGEKLSTNGQGTTAAPEPEIEEGFVLCTGQEVSQQVIDQVVDSIRAVNNGSLVLRGLYVLHTNLTTLDLTPFLGGQFQSIEITDNPVLTKITGPVVVAQDKISAYRLEFTQNNLNDAGISTVLSYFEPKSVKYLNFYKNKIQATFSPTLKSETCEQGPDSDSEFIPGLSAYTSLRYLGMTANRIQRVGSRQFIRNRNLHEIELDYNELEKICPNAFELDPYDDPESEYISIYLQDNQNLTDSSFSSGLNQSSISGTKRGAEVILVNCGFTTLSQDRFLDYLEENTSNTLNFGYADQNYFQCDSRLKWLKDRRIEFEDRVSGLYCANDPGKTAFTSDLVDSQL